MAYCSKCGAQVPDDASFCPKCGNDINAGSPGDIGKDIGMNMDRHMRRAMRRSMRWQWAAMPQYMLVESISAGVILILLGILLYLVAAGVTSWVTWSNFWAYFLIGIGGFLMLRFFLFLVFAPQAGYFRYGGLIWGIILIAIGAAWLSATTFATGLSLWPFIIVLGGILVIALGIARYMFRGRDQQGK